MHLSHLQYTKSHLSCLLLFTHMIQPCYFYQSFIVQMWKLKPREVNCPRFPGSEWWGRDSNSDSLAPWGKDFCFATTGPAFCTVHALSQPITTVCWMNSTAGIGVCVCEWKGGSHGESELLTLPCTASSNTHMLPYILRPLSRILDSHGQPFRRYS